MVVAEVTYGRDSVITNKQLKPFTRRNDWVGLVYLSGHLSALGVTGYLVYLTIGTLWVVPAVFVHGIVITFLYGPMHECSHGTPFRTRWLNEAVFWFCSLIYISTPLWYRYKHANHHTYTQIKGKDTEIVLASPATFGQYILQCTALRFWHRNLGSLSRHVCGKILPSDAAFIPKDQLARNFFEARVTLGIYALVAVAAVAAGSWAPLIYWLIPRIVGEPLIRSVRVAEHTGCEEGPDLRMNTRTTKANPLFKALFWNMPYHAEHHLCPSVPFHKLPTLHREIGGQLHEIGSGYIAVHRHLFRNHLTRKSRSQAPAAG